MVPPEKGPGAGAAKGYAKGGYPKGGGGDYKGADYKGKGKGKGLKEKVMERAKEKGCATDADNPVT